MRDREFEAMTDPFGDIGRERPPEWDGERASIAPAIDSNKRGDTTAILQALDQFNSDETAVIRVLCDRLMLGRQRYKPLDLASDTRNWKRELGEEVMDAVIYASFDYLMVHR